MNSGVRAAAILCVIRSDAAEFLCQGVSLTIDDGKSVRSEFFPTIFIESLDAADADGASGGQPRQPYPPGGENCWGWLGDCTWCLAGILGFALSTFSCIGTTGPAAIACIITFILESGGLIAGCVNCARCLNGPRWASSVPRE